MPRPFRHHHLFRILETFDPKKGALDRFLSSYFKNSRAIGAQDRREIAQKVYTLIRFWRLFDAISQKNLSWEERATLLDTSNSISVLQEQLDPCCPERYGIGPVFFQKLVDSFEQPVLEEQLHCINEQAPIALRTNLLKTSREELMGLLPKNLKARAADQAPHGIILSRRENLLSLPSFRCGLFEIQDEGSQLVSELIACAPGERVLDYCAGAGGKTLAFAPNMRNRGEILLYDIRASLLEKARQRLKRAGIHNIRFCYPPEGPPKKYYNKMDWVVLDVPCSGSGSIRRRPELREHLETWTSLSYVEKQREIFRKAFYFSKPGGFIIYITCSLFKEENDQQVDFFLKRHPITLVKDPIQIKLTTSGPDGFFAALFRKEESQ
ncbi:RsmB/NOP family class I SAM-dependent RNA methyltransferase [Candidatus Similichlamydia laticola]|uniref:Sun protein n=1 Tax=Candidatus Similichlamydia laticola TaxID=2170265 RepID=A0A369K9U2_9BACT|nr:RsmB/NOP family class I SAM-dependent RNA methyltransferase [Candidatus Similichlamydia laticola]RDB31369.1 Sun protein [Candidatus Similichlamydia laticola]